MRQESVLEKGGAAPAPGGLEREQLTTYSHREAAQQLSEVDSGE